MVPFHKDPDKRSKLRDVFDEIGNKDISIGANAKSKVQATVLTPKIEFRGMPGRYGVKARIFGACYRTKLITQ